MRGLKSKAVKNFSFDNIERIVFAKEVHSRNMLSKNAELLALPQRRKTFKANLQNGLTLVERESIELRKYKTIPV